MAFLNTFEKHGKVLLRYRGQVPAILLVLAVPAMYYTSYGYISDEIKVVLTLFSVLFSLIGIGLRAYTIATTPRRIKVSRNEVKVPETLFISGIYSVLRHPIYLGNFFVWSGVALFVFNLWFALLFLLLYGIYFERVIFAEERFMERKYGNQYVEWSLHVPAFIPVLSRFQKGLFKISLSSVIFRESPVWILTAFGYAWIDVLRNYFTFGEFSLHRFSVYFFGGISLLSAVFFLFKHSKSSSSALN